jgi:hypothetical protein
MTTSKTIFFIYPPLGNAIVSIAYCHSIISHGADFAIGTLSAKFGGANAIAISA